ncbi:MAG: hypothetical protein B1H02_07835 [Candidatus Latescibacteria bacterium 4484_107]|nr:MAG: hypothetical protein B1H02_07835 [Candidatus Latescibacteria bacterium 4484_107]
MHVVAVLLAGATKVACAYALTIHRKRPIFGKGIIPTDVKKDEIPLGIAELKLALGTAQTP